MLYARREIQLLPAGDFRSRCGRPNDAPCWRLNAGLARCLTAAELLRRDRFVIDYEHQTLNAEKNGKPVPAAGWFKTLLWRDGRGLFAADVEWSAQARAMIEAGEYRHISALIAYHRETGAVTGLLGAALTNWAAIDGLQEIGERAKTPEELRAEIAVLKAIEDGRARAAALPTDIVALAKQEYAGSSALRAEFAGSGEAGYVAFRQAQAAGKFKMNRARGV